MKKYLPILKTINLFSGINETDLTSLLNCFSAHVKRYQKSQTIIHSGETIDSFGVVLLGQVQIINHDFYGNRNIIINANTGDLFAESFACAHIRAIPVNVTALTDCDILFIDCHKLANTCTKACNFHNRLIQNMLTIVSKKNIALTQKIAFISKRTTAKKLLAYLSFEAKRSERNPFVIPYNRQELADYLCVDRSAMSAELSKLQKEGVIKYHKNTFELLHH